jgi:hypothetical protein
MADPLRRPFVFFLSILLAGACILLPGTLPAEVPDPAPVESPNRKIESLAHLLVTMEQVRREVVAAQSALGSPTSLGKEEGYRARIDVLTTRLAALEEGFEQLATGVEKSAAPPGGTGSAFEWNNELKELLAPLIKEMKRATARPREIQGLRSKLERYDEELRQVERALSNISRLQTNPEVPADLSQRLKTLASKWRHRKYEFSSLQGLTKLTLEEKDRGKRTLSDSLHDFTQLFFKSRGRNLLMALGVLFGTLYIMGRLRTLIATHSRLYRRAQTAYARVFDLIYILITVMTALLATLGTLYLVSDWVLLSIVLIFIVGLLWASKEAVPRVWGQARLLLNIGAVREGERIVYQGVPYKVSAINFYSELENEALQGGRVRLPLEDLFTLRSRTCHPDEPWFPSRCGDWVLLSDNTHAEVTIQSPEYIGLRLLGGASRQLPPATFLAMTPTNLSHGFRMEARFRLAVTHRSDAASTLPKQLETHLTARLAATHWAPNTLMVLYRRTLPSFLELSILADFPGHCAKDHPLIAMALEQHCLETAEEMAWELPSHRMAVQVVPG